MQEAEQANAILNDFDDYIDSIPANIYKMLDAFSLVYKISTDASLTDATKIANIMKIRIDGVPIASNIKEARSLMTQINAVPWDDVWNYVHNNRGQIGGGIMDHLNEALTHAESVLDEIDKANKEFAETRGILLFEHGATNIVIPPGIPIPPKLLVIVLYSLAEIIRIIVTTVPLVPPILSTLMTTLVFIVDVARGQWKHGILTLAGLFGRYALFGGIIGKVLLSVFEMLSPEVKTALFGAIGDLRSSLIMGFTLWAVDVVMPGPVRAVLQELHQKAADVAASIDTKIDETGMPFKHISPLIEKYNVSDLTTLQDLLLNPRIYCSPEVRELIGKAKEFTVIWMLFTALGIPPAAASEEACATMPPIADAILGSKSVSSHK